MNAAAHSITIGIVGVLLFLFGVWSGARITEATSRPSSVVCIDATDPGMTFEWLPIPKAIESQIDRRAAAGELETNVINDSLECTIWIGSIPFIGTPAGLKVYRPKKPVAPKSGLGTRKPGYIDA